MKFIKNSNIILIIIILLLAFYNLKLILTFINIKTNFPKKFKELK